MRLLPFVPFLALAGPWLLPAAMLAQSPAGARYALMLADPPVAERFHAPDEFRGEAARQYRARIEKAQQTLREELARRHFRVTGATQVLANAVYVQAPADRVAELAALPGVKSVVPLTRKFRPQ